MFKRHLHIEQLSKGHQAIFKEATIGTTGSMKTE